MPFGGAGPTHAVMLAIEAQLASVAVPPAAATLCALGAAMADVRREFVRGLGHGRVQALGDRIWENWSALEQEAERWLDGEKVQMLSRRRMHALDMRYSGQSFSITTFVPLEVRDSRSLAGLIAAFHHAHESIYGFHESDHAVEAVTQRLSIIGEVPKLSLPKLPLGNPNPRPRWQRPIYHQGAWIDSAIYRREDFGAQSSAAGPAVIEQDDTSLWVPPGWRVKANDHDILLVGKERKNAA
jgi:N-methylhydantoinase A